MNSMRLPNGNLKPNTVRLLLNLGPNPAQLFTKLTQNKANISFIAKPKNLASMLEKVNEAMKLHHELKVMEESIKAIDSSSA